MVRPILACCLENPIKRYTKFENSSLGPLSGLEGCYNCSLLFCELNCDSFLSSKHMQNRAYKSKRISNDLNMSEQRKETFRLLTTINSRNIIIPAQWYDIYKYLYIYIIHIYVILKCTRIYDANPSCLLLHFISKLSLQFCIISNLNSCAPAIQ